ncbi:MAG: hypothetical protein OSA98_11855 [Rubripirellula sp.]|nr:hypothetical protein [Rubripirellula sp.]
MKSYLLYGMVFCCGLACCATAQAQSAYKSPAKWNNFYPERDTVQKFVLAQVPDELPAPAEVVPAGSRMAITQEVPVGIEMPEEIAGTAPLNTNPLKTNPTNRDSRRRVYVTPLQELVVVYLDDEPTLTDEKIFDSEFWRRLTAAELPTPPEDLQ